MFYVLNVLLLSSQEVHSDTRWGLQIHLCFTNELGEILSYNRFSAGGIDHPRVRLSLEQSHLVTHDRCNNMFSLCLFFGFYIIILAVLMSIAQTILQILLLFFSLFFTRMWLVYYFCFYWLISWLVCKIGFSWHLLYIYFCLVCVTHGDF